MNHLEEHFQFFRKNMIGNEQFIDTPYGKKRLLYADWAASGRLYMPIEEKILHQFAPYVANTHTETNFTGKRMTYAYCEAKKIIKKHVNANENDVLLFEGTGMTGAVRKIQRLLGLTLHEKYRQLHELKDWPKPVVFITHMEHHSNQISWEETLADVVIVPPDENGDVSPVMLEKMLQQYEDRPLKIGAFTACSNVTGIKTPYHQLAAVMHRYGGICFVDFSASAPYVPINMHPEHRAEHLDGIFFSPHKFLGGPGTMGVAIVAKTILQTQTPDRPGGGTVNWTNPWGTISYLPDAEEREDGGTPGFLQAIKTALALRLKEEMGAENISAQDKKLTQHMFTELKRNKKIRVLAENKTERLPIISFYVEDVHYQLIVKLLNDLYGIQVRGGCSCAGTYGHYLFKIDRQTSEMLKNKIEQGHSIVRPGWVRLSLHPTMTKKDAAFIAHAVNDVVSNSEQYKKDYKYLPQCNDYQHMNEGIMDVESWFDLGEKAAVQAVLGK